MLIFTYVHSDVLINPEMFVGATRLHASLAKADEKMTSAWILWTWPAT